MATNQEEDNKIIEEAKKRFTICQEWEAQARLYFDYDFKFANADAHNKYQWDDRIAADRMLTQRPVLTVNRTMQHNLMVINDAKQNKPGVNIRPVGENASFEAAQIFQEVVRHIEYISNAESVYDHATTYQVEAGWGYWRICTEYITDESFDQEIYIRRVKDPRSVYLDPDITEIDGSDARYGFVFEDIAKDLFAAEYPKHTDVGWSTTFDTRPDMWLSREMIRVAEYWRREEEEKKLVTFINPLTGVQANGFLEDMSEQDKEIYKQVKDEDGSNERHVVTTNIQWYKIAGDKIIDRGPWIGKYIPIVRLIGTETVIDGVLDRRGHTRALIDPQKIYNWNTSANAEFGALQTKSPWIGPAAAIEGFEEYYRTANTKNHSFMPYNHIDEDGKEIPPPSRPAPPQASPAYVEQMKIAQNEMMMVSGQFQSQFGENENAKSGIAINARQRQGDRATYHFIDNLAIAIRYTGKQLIDLIPKVYDTKRILRIEANDNSILNVTIDPDAPQAYQKQPVGPTGPQMDNRQQMIDIIFNPKVGMYDVQSETGPSFATKRQEAFNALTQIAAQNKEFMGIAGDLLWKVADFPEAQLLAERWRKIIPPNITGDGPDPQTEKIMHDASNKIEAQLAQMAKMQQELDSKTKGDDIKAFEAETKRKIAIAEQARLDYEAETKRVVALGNAGPGISVEQIQPIVKQLFVGMMNAGEPGTGAGVANAPGPHEGGTPIKLPDAPEEGEGEETPVEPQEGQQEAVPEGLPPDAKKAPDGNFYIPNPNQPGKFLRAVPNA